MISSVFKKPFHGLQFDILDPYKRFILFEALNFGKMLIFLEKQSFFRADMARLGKYCMGGYGRIRVYRVMERGVTNRGVTSPKCFAPPSLA